MKKLALFLVLALGLTVGASGTASAATVSQASAVKEVSLQAVAVSYWNSGIIHEHYNRGGLQQKTVFPDYGPCDNAGYRLNLRTGQYAGWGTFISSIHTWKYHRKSCNAVTIRMRSNPGIIWTCDPTCMANNETINIGGGFNDNVGEVYWHAYPFRG